MQKGKDWGSGITIIAGVDLAISEGSRSAGCSFGHSITGCGRELDQHGCEAGGVKRMHLDHLTLSRSCPVRPKNSLFGKGFDLLASTEPEPAPARSRRKRKIRSSISHASGS